MSKNGRCIKGWGAATWGKESDAFAKLAEHLKRVLGREVLIPCNKVYSQYCEVCFKNDPGKIFCLSECKRAKSYDSAEYKNASVYDDLTDWMCGSCGSYWTGYDDGTICDCGTPFVVDWSSGEYEDGEYRDEVSFRPLRNTEERPGFVEGPTYVNEDTGAPRWSCFGGFITNEEWENLDEEEKRESHFTADSRPPNVSPKACLRKPDISSIFKLSIRGTMHRGYELVQSDSNSCILEDTILAYHNGEPIDEETRQDEAGDHRWCEAKCDANSECGGWTLNKSNGWCALKRTDQIKEQENKNYVSGTKNC